jgi:hypothetical protein
VATRFPSIKGSIVVDDEFGYMSAPTWSRCWRGWRPLWPRARRARTTPKSMFAAPKIALAYERLFLCVKNVAFCAYPAEFD